MCGIVGAVSEKNNIEFVLEGLRRLEYRGYDSAGLGLIDSDHQLLIIRKLGKVSALEKEVKSKTLSGNTVIAHTRWATHGKPSEANAHPHQSHQEIAVVHNGIIENYLQLKQFLESKEYDFTSETDSEVIAHLIHWHYQACQDWFEAFCKSMRELRGAYAIAMIVKQNPNTIYATKKGSPLVIGIGENESFIASDQLALIGYADRMMVLDDGEFAKITADEIFVIDSQNKVIDKKSTLLEKKYEVSDKQGYRHFMQKEIFEQPVAIANTLMSAIKSESIDVLAFGEDASSVFSKVANIQIVACGTSFHAGLIAKYWLEDLAEIPCSVDIASEFRYRKTTVAKNTLFIAISQSGETADTLAALEKAKQNGYLSTLAICNVAHSALVRESHLAFITRAGTEIGVASTKAFTTQLVSLLLLSVQLTPDETKRKYLLGQVIRLPQYCQEVLSIDTEIQIIAKQFIHKAHALFLGRGTYYPLAMEAALKLKELSYIHAEAFPAGELKHGPLALIDEKMPVIAIIPNDELFSKIKSNIEEVKARGGQLYLFSDTACELSSEPGLTVLELPSISEYLAPIVYMIPLQLFAYHVAVLKGTDVDQPRNLAKSVTVE